ncbi:MAG: hypothetical protein ABJB05_12420 [Parafilimonas sp.]
MRYLKALVIGLVSLFILLTAIGLLMPSSVTVGRSVEIKAPVDSVRFYTNDPVEWRLWIHGADIAYFKQLTATSNTKNSKIILGTYTVTVLNNDPKYIITVWNGQTAKEQLNRLDLYYNSSTDVTVVNWSFQQQLSWFPWDRLGAMLYDNVYGPSMEVSLNKLKQLCEK